MVTTMLSYLLLQRKTGRRCKGHGGAMHEAGIEPEEVDYINAHSTGTQIQ